MISSSENNMSWKVHPEFPKYEVSEFGDIRRTENAKTRRKGSRAKIYVNTDGYLAASLTDKDGEKRHVLVHRLVKETFDGPSPHPNMEVAHNNGSRLFNHYTNLRWATRKSNAEDQQIHETALKGMANGRAKITDDDVRNIRREYRLIKIPGSGRSVTELEIMYDLHRATVVNIAMGRSWAHVPDSIERSPFEALGMDVLSKM